MEQLYSAILDGRLDLRLPLANGQAPEQSILLSRLVAMPAQQHMQLQASPTMIVLSRVKTPRGLTQACSAKATHSTISCNMG